MEMKRIAALILVGLFLFAGLNVKSAVAEDVQYAEISSVQLGLRDKAVLGPYSFTFADFDPDNDAAKILISGGSESSGVWIEDGQTVYYPSNDEKHIFALSVTIWGPDTDPTVYLDIKSPLKLIDTVTLQEGKYYTLPSSFPEIKVKLIRSTNDYATFNVYLPYSSDPTTVKIYKGSGRGVAYKLNDEYRYEDYLYIKVTDSDSDSATFEVYLPKVASVDFNVIKEGSDDGSSDQNSQEIEPVYNDLLYVDENLPVKVENTTYYVKLISVVSTKASIEIYKESTKVSTYFVNVGEVKAISDTPLKISIQNTEPQYNRCKLVVYAPADAQVTPILRSANIVADIDATPKEIMLDDSLVVVVSVENRGKGDAYDVAVAAPIPNNFELVSLTKSWTFETFPAFTKMPALIYVLKPTKVGEFDIGKVTVTFYDDKSLETGRKKTIYSQSLTGIKVYNVPSIDVSAQAYNGTWGDYVTAEVGDNVSLKFTLRASEGNPNYEFVKSATLILDLPDSVDGKKQVEIGTIRAGETKTSQLNLTVLNEDLINIKATLVYLDPLGEEHRLELGNLVTINSLPPKAKEVKVWPTPEELPAYVNQTLAEMDNPTPLAEELADISADYLPPGSNPWKPFAILLLIVAFVLAGASYKYWDEAERLREKLERKKQKRPGGLPKKAEEETEGSEIVEL